MQLILLAFLGLLFGSFINVIIYRLPIMVKESFVSAYQEITAQTVNAPANVFNLAWPNSFCPQCHTPLKSWHNIPLFSYCFLKGKCAFCRKPIPIRYPIVELLTSLVSVAVGFHFDYHFQILIFTLTFSYTLIALIFIDLQEQILPDQLTLSLIWIGLICNLNDYFTPLPQAVLGAVIGYLILWLIAQIFKIITRVDGLGYGDCKLMAALGAWFGWQNLPLLLVISSLTALIINCFIMLVTKEKSFRKKIAFGPYLALAGFTMLFIR